MLLMRNIAKKSTCNFVRKNKEKRVTNMSGYGILWLCLIKNESH